MNINHTKRIFLAIVGASVFASGLAARADYPSTVLSDNPAAYWRFSETPMITPTPLLATTWDWRARRKRRLCRNRDPGCAGSVTGFKRHLSHGWRVGIGAQFDRLESRPALLVEFWIKPNPASGTLTCPLLFTDFTPTPRLGWLFLHR